MGGQLGDAITRIPGALVNKVLEAAQRKLESIFQTIVTAIFGGGGGTITGGGGARAWIIAHESGGNPRAQNPTSSASGLYQMIDGTWRAYGGSTAHAKDASVAEQDAVANRYVASRYGSWENAQAFWQSHGYYDNGGWLQPGTTLATNMTGSPEAILTLPQLGALSRGRGVSREEIASIVDEIMSRLSGGGDTYNVMLPEKATVQELANSLDFKRRVVSKGRYVR
jgi:SLT domain-containing protein